MSVRIVWDVIKALLPRVSEALKDAFAALHKTRRRRQHIFVLKAITTNRDSFSQWPPPAASQFELFFIERQIMAAMVEEALGQRFNNVRVAKAMYEFLSQEQLKKLKKVAFKYGLPAMHDPRQTEKIESVLHDMVEARRLQFHPPTRWSIV